MDSRWTGLAAEAVRAVQLAESAYRQVPRLVTAEDDRTAVAGRLTEAELMAPAEASVGIRALRKWLDGDLAQARELTQHAAVAVLISDAAWGPAAAALVLDRGHGALMVDFARRLALSRPDDAEACTWALRTLIRTGNEVLAVRLARERPHAEKAEWTAAVAAAARSIGRRGLAVEWIRSCIAGPAFDDAAEELLPLLDAMPDILDSGEAQELVGEILRRWRDARSSQVDDHASALWQLVERANDPTLALQLAALLDGKTTDTLRSEDARRAGERLQRSGIRVGAALLAVAVFDRHQDVASGIDALAATRRALDIDRQRAVLQRILALGERGDLSDLTESQTTRLLDDAAAAVMGLREEDRENVRRRLIAAGLAVDSTAFAGIPQVADASIRDMLAVAYAQDFKALVDRGSFGQARAVALRGALAQRAGALPGRLAVDALVNAGAILEAHQLALRLLDMYPDDQGAITAALVTVAWRARSDEAAVLVERVIATKPRLALQLPDALRQVAAVNPRAAVAAARVAIDDPAFTAVKAELAELLDVLQPDD